MAGYHFDIGDFDTSSAYGGDGGAGEDGTDGRGHNDTGGARRVDWGTFGLDADFGYGSWLPG